MLVELSDVDGFQAEVIGQKHEHTLLLCIVKFDSSELFGIFLRHIEVFQHDGLIASDA